jgi:hypothetical protein
MIKTTKKEIESVRRSNRIERFLRYGILLLGVYAVIYNVLQVNIVNKGSNDMDYFYTQSEQGTYYYFPSTPIYNIYSILNESIGSTILKDLQQNPLRNCSPTVQYRLRIPQSKVTASSGNNIDSDVTTTWILQSMMMNLPQHHLSQQPRNQDNSASLATNLELIPKLYGGDEIYVQWETDHTDDNRNDYMGVAQVTDNNDGTYLLKFIRPPMLQFNYTNQRKSHQQERQQMSGNINSTEQRTLNDNKILKVPLPQQYGQLTIYYEYTCGIGRLFAPDKDQYTRGGEVFQTLTSTIKSNTSNSSMATQLVPRPYIHDFIPPNRKDDSTATSTNNVIDLSKYDKILAFGDSLIAQLVRRFSGEGSWSDNILWYQNVCQCLSSDSDANSMIYKLHSRHGHQILRNFRRSKRIAIITGSSSWDAMRGCVHEDMIDHVNAIRTFINNITVSYPGMDIYWKAPSAFFLHRYTTYIDAFNETYFQTLRPKYGIVPLKPRYINYHVPQQLYHVQKELMKELGIPFLDLYDSYYLSAPWTVPGDSRHFDDTLTRLQLSYFWPGLLDKPIYTKA